MSNPANLFSIDQFHQIEKIFLELSLDAVRIRGYLRSSEAKLTVDPRRADEYYVMSAAIRDVAEEFLMEKSGVAATDEKLRELVAKAQKGIDTLPKP